MKNPERFEHGKEKESPAYFLAKCRFFEELDELARKYDNWKEKVARIRAGEKLKRSEAIILQMAIEAAQNQGLSSIEHNRFINEFLLSSKAKHDDW